MENDIEFFKVERIEHMTKITNDTNYVLIISIRPTPPKRKYKDAILVPSRKSTIFEYEIDLATISFRLENDITKGMQ